jgi:hypothetical protein
MPGRGWRNRFLSPLEEEYKPTMAAYSNVAPRDPVSNCLLQAARHRTWLRNGLRLGERAALFRFQSSSARRKSERGEEGNALIAKHKIILAGK